MLFCSSVFMKDELRLEQVQGKAMRVITGMESIL